MGVDNSSSRDSIHRMVQDGQVENDKSLKMAFREVVVFCRGVFCRGVAMIMMISLHIFYDLNYFGGSG